MAAYRQLMWALVFMVVALGTSVGYTIWQSHTSDQRWCAVLQTINKADAKINKSTAQEKKIDSYGYQLVQEFRAMQPQFGCGKPPVPKGA